MFTLRRTRKLLDRVGGPAGPSGAPADTRLGDWYANILFLRPQQLILAVSERTLLPVVIPAGPLSTLAPRLVDATGAALLALGIDEAAVRAEQAAMARVAIDKTANRRVLGSMNDFTNLLSYDLPGRTLLELSLRLAESPSSPIGMNSPDDATREVFTGPAGLHLIQ